MPIYSITNRVTRETYETYEIDAPYAQDAAERLAWQISDCYVQLLRETPYTDLTKQPRRIETPTD